MNLDCGCSGNHTCQYHDFSPSGPFDTVEEAKQYLLELRESQGMNYLIGPSEGRTAISMFVSSVISIIPFAIVVGGVFLAGTAFPDHHLWALVPALITLNVAVVTK